MNYKTIPSRIWVEDYIVRFSYTTKRNNFKEQKRIISQINKELTERDFWIWINTQNEDKPYRAMSNVKILDIERTNGRYIAV